MFDSSTLKMVHKKYRNKRHSVCQGVREGGDLVEERNCWWSYVTVFVRLCTFLLEKYLCGPFPGKHEIRKNKIEQVEEGALSVSLMCASDSTLDLLEGVFVAGMFGDEALVLQPLERTFSF